jgi:ubiquinone/menaquinone biosynthesis C-methylase UbiE
VQRTLSVAEAKAFYDRFGARQDWQWIYEDAATRRLADQAALGEARFVVEFGCGTGRFAAGLLARRLPPEARYLGLDVSDTMVRLATRRLARFGPRARVVKSDGSPRLPLDRAADRVISTYVLDLLAEEDIAAFLDSAARALVPGGRLCLTSLTFASGSFGRLVTWAWQAVARRRPTWLGGCRPLRLRPRLDEARWSIAHHEIVERLGLASEVLIAVRRD